MMKLKIFFLLAVALLAIMPAKAQIFYKIEGNGLEKPSYIFGTHHLAPLSVIEKAGALKSLEEVDRIVGEIDMTQDQISLAMAMQPHMLAPADSTLSKLISPDDFALVNEEFKKWAPMPGMELSMFDGMKPTVVTAMVALGMASQEMPDFNPREQLDTYFQTYGKETEKTLVPLETVDFQASVLYDSMPLRIQAEALVETLKHPAKSIQAAKELNAAYENADLDKMLQLSEQDDEHPEFMTALLDRRNADWLTKLPEIMKSGSSFIAVGALHLPGPKGLLEGLRKLGYTVTPIKK